MTSGKQTLDALSTALEGLRRLHHVVDRLSEPLRQHHVARLKCHRGCSGCCVDNLHVFSIEAARIRQEHASLLEKGSAHSPGACAFLSEDGACRIYASRPYVCRTQGLPLRWFEVYHEQEIVEHRDICPLNETEQAIEALDAEECWTIGPVEDKLRELEEVFTQGQAKRINLRDLFKRCP